MKSYIVMSKWLGGAAPVGVFTSLELAHKEVKKWCENHRDEWEMSTPVNEYSHYTNTTQCDEWWMSIKEFEVDQLETEE